MTAQQVKCKKEPVGIFVETAPGDNLRMDSPNRCIIPVTAEGALGGFAVARFSEFEGVAEPIVAAVYGVNNSGAELTVVALEGAECHPDDEVDFLADTVQDYTLERFTGHVVAEEQLLLQAA